MQKKAHLVNNADQQAEQQQELERIQKQKEWAETKALASNFGAPVFFEDAPEEEKDESAEQIDPAGPQEITEPEPLPEENNPVEDNVIEPTAVASPDFHSFNEVALQKTTSSFANMSSEALAKEEATANTAKKKPRKKRIHKPRVSQTNNSTIELTSPKKPPLSLAQLTQGFMHRLKDEGRYAVSMLGNKSGRPTEEQLKYERYLQKLEWCFQNSLRINRDRIPPTPQDATVYIRMILNRDGTPQQLSVAKPSGNILLDKFILFVFQDASSSFPPIPPYLKDDPFAITCLVPCSRQL